MEFGHGGNFEILHGCNKIACNVAARGSVFNYMLNSLYVRRAIREKNVMKKRVVRASRLALTRRQLNRLARDLAREWTSPSEIFQQHLYVE
jgi:hypothetical protein